MIPERCIGAMISPTVKSQLSSTENSPLLEFCHIVFVGGVRDFLHNLLRLGSVRSIRRLTIGNAFLSWTSA